MERKSMAEGKREHPNNASSTTNTMPLISEEIPTTFPFQPSTAAAIFDTSCDHNNNKASFGFMDLLAVDHDYSAPLFDWLHSAADDDSYSAFLRHAPSPDVPDSSEVLNTPASPNLSSISSSSNEATANNNNNNYNMESDHQSGKPRNNNNIGQAEEQGGGGDRGDDQDQDKTKKQLKAKKKNQKKQREPRFAFMTKSEVDHLDDGYKWRKYGQKAVKNSPYPRSYYRCTSAGCGVKKRVERSSDDPSVVVTTYEGTHTHPCPASSRATFAFGSPHLMLPRHHQQSPFMHPFTSSSSSNYDVNTTSFARGFLQDHPNPRDFATEALLRDNGLLQDIILPTNVRKEEID
ncbi:hypothetical protein Fmac_009594 [Flemingia macrophylla]|uniref:WRKY domain-containing protein n=1 Tax=Flemingia macrophylla TaxID=520843 RepID=A0ABD1N0S9_9FABA